MKGGRHWIKDTGSTKRGGQVKERRKKRREVMKDAEGETLDEGNRKERSLKGEWREKKVVEERGTYQREEGGTVIAW